MKRNTIRILYVPILAAVLSALATGRAAAQTTHYDSKPGAKMRIEGTSNVHDWQVEGKIIGGSLEAGKGFPTEPGATVKPGKVEAQAEVFVPIKSLSSVNKDGSPYSKPMDDIMHEKLKFSKQSRISYRLTELTLKQAPKSKEAPYLFEAVGELGVAGVTNKITMPVEVFPLGGGKLKVTGSVKTKMTDFKIEPPSPIFTGGLIKTGDEVTLRFEWPLTQAKATANAAK